MYFRSLLYIGLLAPLSIHAEQGSILTTDNVYKMVSGKGDISIAKDSQGNFTGATVSQVNAVPSSTSANVSPVAAESATAPETGTTRSYAPGHSPSAEKIRAAAAVSAAKDSTRLAQMRETMGEQQEKLTTALATSVKLAAEAMPKLEAQGHAFKQTQEDIKSTEGEIEQTKRQIASTSDEDARNALEAKLRQQESKLAALKTQSDDQYAGMQKAHSDLGDATGAAVAEGVKDSRSLSNSALDEQIAEKAAQSSSVR